MLSFDGCPNRDVALERLLAAPVPVLAFSFFSAYAARTPIGRSSRFDALTLCVSRDRRGRRCRRRMASSPAKKTAEGYPAAVGSFAVEDGGEQFVLARGEAVDLALIFGGGDGCGEVAGEVTDACEVGLDERSRLGIGLVLPFFEDGDHGAHPVLEVTQRAVEVAIMRP
jgi:hypothetical protein